MRKWFEGVLNGNGKIITIAIMCVLVLGLTCGVLAYVNTEKENSNKNPSVSNTSSSAAGNKATASNKSIASSSLNSSSDQSTVTASSSMLSVSNNTSKQTEKGFSQTESSANSTTSAPTSASVSVSAEQSSGHTHNWVATQQTIHHDAVITREAWDETTYTTESYSVCNTCGFRDGIDGDLFAHMNDAMASYISENPDTEDGLHQIPHASFHEEYVSVPHTVHHDAEVTPAWDETITVYICSECGAVQ